MKRYGLFLFLGTIFGFALSRAGATRFDIIADMFRFRNAQLYFVIGTAFVLNLIAFQILRRSGATGRYGMPFNLPDRIFHPGIIPGAIIFGVGWAITGTCPGTAMAQLGEGHLSARLVIGGVFAGAWIYPRVHARYFHWQASRCGE
jgi:uncharacterized membrane protein YedE/YeeE